MSMHSGSIQLLSRDALVKTGDVDYAEWNFRPFLGWIQRIRFRLIVQLLGERKYSRLLEIGYGSGVFMPELARHCRDLDGIDPHAKNEEVHRILEAHGTTANLISGSAEAMPYPDCSFDCVVAVSSMEFVHDLRAACLEIRRILQPSGVFVLVTPGHTPIVDLGLKILTGESADASYGDRRQQLMPTLTENFAIEKRQSSSFLGVTLIRLYTAMRLSPATQP